MMASASKEHGPGSLARREETTTAIGGNTAGFRGFAPAAARASTRLP